MNVKLGKHANRSCLDYDIGIIKAMYGFRSVKIGSHGNVAEFIVQQRAKLPGFMRVMICYCNSRALFKSACKATARAMPPVPKIKIFFSLNSSLVIFGNALLKAEISVL